MLRYAIKKIGFSILLLFISPAIGFSAANSEQKKLPKDALKIQFTDRGTVPWHDFYSAAPHNAFNLAVHGEPLHFTSDMNITPGYIKTWKWDSTRNLFVMQLDPEKKYHNGLPISSYDFEFALIKPKLTPFEGMEGAFLSQIKGLEKVKRGEKFQSGMVEGIKVIDQNTIEIAPSVNPSRFLYSMNTEVPALAPRDSFKEDFFTFKDIPMGCGPYRVFSYDEKLKTVGLEKVRADNSGMGPHFVEIYYGDSPDYKAEIVIGPAVSRLKKLDYEKKLDPMYLSGNAETPVAIAVLEFNYTHPAVKNRDFRRAIEFGIGKPDASRAASLPTDQLIPRGNFGYQTLKPYSNLEEAKKIWSKLPASLRNDTYKIIVHGAKDHQEVIENYRKYTDNLEKIGLKVKLVAEGNMSFTEDRSDAAMGIYGRTTDASPLVTLSVYMPEDGKKNAPAADKTYVDLMKKAETAEDPISRSKLIHQLTQHIIDEAIVVPLAERYDTHFWTPKVKKVVRQELTGFLDISKLQLTNHSGL